VQTNSDTASRNERRALIALVAVFALIVQAFWPLAAAAAPTFGGATALICTGHSLETAPAGAPDKGAAGQPCQHCVCPTAAALPTVEVACSSEAVRYVRTAPAVRSAQDPGPGRGLAAPPPPGRGPPVLMT